MSYKISATTVDYAIPFDNTGTNLLSDNVHDAIIESFGDGGVARDKVVCGYGGNAGSGKWLEFFQTNPSNSSPLTYAENGTIRAISAGMNGTFTVTFGLYVNAVQVDTLVITSDDSGHKDGLLHSVDAGDKVSVKVESGSISNCVMNIFIKVL